MLTCRACGIKLLEQEHCENMENYVEIYFNLTALGDYEAPGLTKICLCCAEKLKEFDRFRKVCLRVHWLLYNIKSETTEEDTTQEILTVECKQELLEEREPEQNVLAPESDDRTLESSDDNESEYYDNDDDDDDDDDEFKSSDDEGAKMSKTETKPKKIRAKWGSLEKKEPKERRTVYPCDRCHKKFFVLFRFKAHKRMHDGLVPYECELCGKAFPTAHNVKRHYMQKHSTNRLSLPCDHPGCGQVFATRQGFNRHKDRVHNPNYVMPSRTAFICDMCGKEYTTKGGLKTHKYTHTPAEMPFVCKICSKKFPTSAKLKEHTMRHEGVRNHTCPHCGLQKVSGHELRTHIKNMHSEPRSYSCDICARQFSNTSSLGLHVKIVHLGVKPYVCTVCEFAFGRSDHLKRHMKSHMRAGLIK
ncbi:gastrula zinc finger protein XlCGF46.1-like isoform X2 [Topomyia yanbarensis]|uniref:gastrula zinc finger protein XlCGF46.1-like isoform X2 n=1 Tax=Topomyia yanbarensis TaxID=2498891 RepID=UPI00273AD1F9|nr:gastrula zinc finger protein XlCGF46.1-like isoform X2 [Topomyia yanbarensis]